jgi:hypothetical protein
MTNAKAIALSGANGIGMDSREERRKLQEQNVSRDETLLITVYDSQLVRQLIGASRGYNQFAKYG